jgi:hypothetical protein
MKAGANAVHALCSFFAHEFHHAFLGGVDSIAALGVLPLGLLLVELVELAQGVLLPHVEPVHSQAGIGSIGAAVAREPLQSRTLA